MSENLLSLTKAKLVEMAISAGVEGAEAMTRPQLIQALSPKKVAELTRDLTLKEQIEALKAKRAKD